MYLIGQLHSKELLYAQQTHKTKNAVQWSLDRLVCLRTGQVAHGETGGKDRPLAWGAVG